MSRLKSIPRTEEKEEEKVPSRIAALVREGTRYYTRYSPSPAGDLSLEP